MGVRLGSPVVASGWDWADAMFGKRRRSADPSPLPTMAVWSDTLSYLRVNQRNFLGDGDQMVQRVFQHGYMLYLRSTHTAAMALKRTAALLATYLQRASPLQVVISICIAGLALFLALLILVRSSQNRRLVSRHLFKQTSSAVNEAEIDSDEFEFEEDDTEDPANEAGGMTRRLRKVFTLSRGQRRSGSKEPSSTRRPASVIRITSSDPRSQLSAHALQMDLDHLRHHGARSGQTQEYQLRRRKESGRLLNAVADPPAVSSSPSPRVVHTAGRAAKQRRLNSRTSEQERRTSKPDGIPRPGSSNMSEPDEEGDGTPTSPNSVHSFTSAYSGEDPEWRTTDGLAPLKLASILRREPQFYASLPMLPDEAMQSESSNISLTSWNNGAPTLVTEFAHSNSYPPLPPSSALTNRTSRLPPGAGHASSSPLARRSSAPRLGTLTPEQARALWPEKRARRVRLLEPDWKPYVEVHERARERIEKLAELASLSRSASPMLVSGSSVSEEGSGNSSHTGEDDEDFWFERFTKSTAASGRDWDWRKRRARQAAARRAALSATEGSNTYLTHNPSFSAPTDVSRRLQTIQKPLPRAPGDSAVYLPEHGDVATAPLHAAGASTRSNSTSHSPMRSAIVQKMDPVYPLECEADGTRVPDTSNGASHHDSVFIGSQEEDFTGQSTLVHATRSRRFSDTDQIDADRALSVPGRLSSLRPKGVKKMMMAARKEKLAGAGVGAAGDSSRPSSATKLQDGDTGGLNKPSLEDNLSLDGWTVERPQKRSNEMRKSVSLAHLDQAYSVSSPDPALHVEPPMSSLPLLDAQSWSDQQIRSSADAYGSAKQHGARSNSLFARPTGGPPASRAETVIPQELAELYGTFIVPSASEQTSEQPRQRGREPSMQPTATESDLSTVHTSYSAKASPAPSNGDRTASRNGVQPAAARNSKMASPNPSKRGILASAQQAAQSVSAE